MAPYQTIHAHRLVLCGGQLQVACSSGLFLILVTYPLLSNIFITPLYNRYRP